MVGGWEDYWRRGAIHGHARVMLTYVSNEQNLKLWAKFFFSSADFMIGPRIIESLVITVYSLLYKNCSHFFMPVVTLRCL